MNEKTSRLEMPRAAAKVPAGSGNRTFSPVSLDIELKLAITWAVKKMQRHLTAPIAYSFWAMVFRLSILEMQATAAPTRSEHAPSRMSGT